MRPVRRLRHEASLSSRIRQQALLQSVLFQDGAELAAQTRGKVTREELYKVHDTVCREALTLMRAKNVDYANESDPFRNFRTFGLLGIVVRLSDKLARLHSLVERGLDQNAVRDETYADTVRDIVNYAIIFEAMARETQGKQAQGNVAPDYLDSEIERAFEGLVIKAL
jgi:hypothetical protein